MTPHSKRSSRHKSRSKLWLAIGIIVIIILGIGIYEAFANSSNKPANSLPSSTPTPSTTQTSNTEYSANSTKILLHTSAGDITLELRDDKPITATNFVNIVEKGWYDGTIFHRTMAGFMIQGGMIENHTVSAISDEIGQDNRNLPYTIAMAKTSDPNSATSQFFINVVDNGNNYVDQAHTIKFDSVYTVFGKVISGQNVVDTIANAPVTTNPYNGEPSVPINPVTIISATIIS